MKFTKLTVVIPAAGLGSRFSQQGFIKPKPLIDIFGKPMIQWVVENLGLDAEYVFIVQQQHIDDFSIDQELKKIIPCTIVTLPGLTDGAARSVLAAEHLINNNNPLLIVNSDNLIEWDKEKVMSDFNADDIDGGIITIYGEGPKWSYALVSKDNLVTKVAEKIQISNNATTGHYYWKHGKDFVQAAKMMIEQNIRYNNEFYIAPAYNQAIEMGKKIIISQAEKFWSVGTPEDLKYFQNNCDVSKVR